LPTTRINTEVKMPDPGAQSPQPAIPEWILNPPPGESILIAKKGEGKGFPEYLEEALLRYEQENRDLPNEPGFEGSCANRCEEQSVF